MVIAVGAAHGRSVTACRCCRCRCRWPRASPPSARRGGRRGAGRQVGAASARPAELAGARHHAPGRDEGAGHRGLHARAARTSPTTSAAAPGFVPLANTVTESSSDRDYVEAYAASGNVVIGTPDDAIAYIEDLHRAVRRVRHVPAARPRLGRPRGDDALVPAVRPRGRSPTSTSSWPPPEASHEWATAKRERAVRPGRAGHARTPSPPTSRRQAADARRWSREGGGRCGPARSWSATTSPSPVPGFGQVLVRVKACGICGSDLHFAKHGAEMLALSTPRWRACPTWAAPELDLGRRRLHGPRVRRRGARDRPRHRRARRRARS